mmetsp:Transcript_22802/g.71765  ORF Transcript_22802/g.71765 Transcript_22802/m.71765 type:complete len:273 (-) Transcript_22802:224-1042(-)
MRPTGPEFPTDSARTFRSMGSSSSLPSQRRISWPSQSEQHVHGSESQFAWLSPFRFRARLSAASLSAFCRASPLSIWTPGPAPPSPAPPKFWGCKPQSSPSRLGRSIGMAGAKGCTCSCAAAGPMGSMPQPSTAPAPVQRSTAEQGPVCWSGLQTLKLLPTAASFGGGGGRAGRACCGISRPCSQPPRKFCGLRRSSRNGTTIWLFCLAWRRAGGPQASGFPSPPIGRQVAQAPLFSTVLPAPWPRPAGPPGSQACQPSAVPWQASAASRGL